ncbi:hypothetical protein T8K17_22190 [Thalassobaculum sp. OXR-137]|uniref:DUF7666 domain-containing protein n=1 Tax=Thalassobaculum sp. OXR-137 TaxID=3100173 RepID=UPI002AC8D51F|nr:hypothetical protein [Thalassobaculum sp. OXR-137]WPZ33937.1 hypothetical protein T8K17_22190 [Thalassobaculum sp. OXR-137]
MAGARVLAWHFVDETLKDGRPVPPDGERLTHDGPVSLCEGGLHASERVLDALKFAPGNIICRVECDDVAERQADKLVCGGRTILWRIDGEEVLRAFARKVALDVAEYWEMPAEVRKFLETGNDNLRVAARGAARQASRDAVLSDEPQAAAAGEAARAAAARTHAARSTGLAAAWAASKATRRADAWEEFDRLLETMIEEARAAAPPAAAEDDEWGDFADEIEAEFT